MARQADQSVHSGNTVLLKVNGHVVGRAQSLDGRRSYGTEGVYEIGSIMPQEHINNRYEGTVSLERFLIKTADLAKVGMAALGEEILNRPVIDIEVIDKAKAANGDSDATVRIYRGCTAVDYSENFRVGAISGENATFQYLTCDTGDGQAAYNANIGADGVSNSINGNNLFGGNIDSYLSENTFNSQVYETYSGNTINDTTGGGTGNDTVSAGGGGTTNP